MKLSRTENLSKMADICIAIALIVTCSILSTPEYSTNGEWNFTVFIIFWANYFISLGLLLTWNKKAPIRKFVYFRLPHWSSAFFGILLNLIYIMKGQINEEAIVYIVNFIWPIYIGVFYYLIIITMDIIVSRSIIEEKKDDR